MHAIIETGGKQYKVGYRLRQGHRQPYTKVEIKKINA